MDGVLAQADAWFNQSNPSTQRLFQICTANPEFVIRAQQDTAFMQILQESDLCIPDGIGLVYASAWQGDRLDERVAGSELVYHLAKKCADKKWRLFLLGAAEGIAAEAAEKLQELYPDLVVAGTWSGSPDPAENDAIVEKIVAAKTDVLYVAFGAPKQDKWIARNRDSLKSVTLALGVGGSLDFITGRIQRAPKWIQSIGFEWLFRLWKEPWRWRRMLALPKFTILALIEAWGKR